MTIDVFKPRVRTNGAPFISHRAVESPVSLIQLKQRVRDQVVAIGAIDPSKASRISHSVVRCNWTTREIDALRDLGLHLGDFSSPARLLGGGLEDLAAAIFQAVVAKGIQLMVSGNEDELRAQVDKPAIKATITMPDGSKEEGMHTGTRLVEKKGNRLCCFWPIYEIEATGEGRFQSGKVTYIGSFFNNLFHDQTGKAQYFVNNDIRYTGCFKEGKRHGDGTLEKYDLETTKWYPQFIGSWNEDRPQKGDIFYPNGEKKPYEDFSYTTTNGQGSFSPTENGVVAVTNPLKIGPGTLSTPIHSSPGLHPSSPALCHSPLTPLLYSSPEENPLIQAKLKNPQKELTVEESVSLLTQCIRYGEIQAHKADGKELLIFIGNTGAGKSTTANYLAGCTLALKKPEELGLGGLENVVVVVPPEKGGHLPELMPIGHTKSSKTFMPQIETPQGSSITLCDCPGFLDNRGAEINIANAVNIRAAIKNAADVKVIILINYFSLLADRGRGLSEMLTICSNLFGSPERLVQHKDSLLIGVTHARSEMSMDQLKRWITSDSTPLMTTLSERLFTFDPTAVTPPADRWNREKFLEEIGKLTPIRNPGRIFNTVLTNEDEMTLIRISEEISRRVEEAFQKKQYHDAAISLHQLEELSVIGHDTIRRLINKSREPIEHQFETLISQFTANLRHRKFPEAQELLSQLQEALPFFPFVKKTYSELQGDYQGSLDEYNRIQQREQDLKNQIATTQQLAANIEQERQRLHADYQERLRIEEERRNAELKKQKDAQELNALFSQALELVAGSNQNRARNRQDWQVIDYPDGVYNGEAKSNKRNGFGCMNYRDRMICLYEGKWKDDVRHGPGRLYYNDGRSFAQEYRFGKLVSSRRVSDGSSSEEESS